MWHRDVRGAPEGSTEAARQHVYWRSLVSFTTKSPPPQAAQEEASEVTLLLPPRWASQLGQHLSGQAGRSINTQTSSAENFFSVWAQHDVQEAEEGELQRAGLWSRIPGRRRLFPLVKVRQLQDDGFTEQLLRGLQLQDSGLFWRDSAQKLQKGKNKTLENTFFFWTLSSFIGGFFLV